MLGAVVNSMCVSVCVSLCVCVCVCVFVNVHVQVMFRCVLISHTAVCLNLGELAAEIVLMSSFSKLSLTLL